MNTSAKWRQRTNNCCVNKFFSEEETAIPLFKIDDSIRNTQVKNEA